MKSSQIGLLLTSFLLGIWLFCAYYQSFKNEPSYIESKYWYGTPKPVILALIVFQILAAIGFIIFFFAQLLDAPTEGLLSYANGWVSVILVSIFLLASIWWPYTLKSENWTTVASLVIAAIACMLLVAGSFEAATTGSIYDIMRVVGSLLLGTVVVLADGVGWNAKFVLSQQNSN